MQTKIKQLLTKSLTPRRFFSQYKSIPRLQTRVRDNGFDNYMEIEKKTRKILKFQQLFFTPPTTIVSIARLDTLSRRIGFKMHEAGRFILKFPLVFEVFEHPVQRILFCRLTRLALSQIQQENDAILRQIPDAVTRLRKFIMLMNTGRVRLDHVRFIRYEFGLPIDFEDSVILKHPEYFRLFEEGETRIKYVELVEKDDSSLRVCEIERLREREYREKGADAEDTRFSFLVNFPHGFKLGRYMDALWNWQRLPYWSPYEDISGYDFRSFEAQERMEKRGVAMIHELLSLTVEKRMSLERIAFFKMAMDLPNKMKEFLLRHQGTFYICTRGNNGVLHTVFLREAYWKGQLLNPNEIYLARRKLTSLVLISPRKLGLDDELVSYSRDGGGLEDVKRVEKGTVRDRLDVLCDGEAGGEFSEESDVADENDETGNEDSC